ncbi:MAG: ATP-binding protein, partial [Romboutsia sp.]|nr:ATP-binding protein [Romboutsia sp.]
EETRNIVRLCETDKGVLRQEGVPFIFNHKKLDELPHIGLFGGSGSGKSFGLRVLAEEIQEKRIPNIIIDPHNELDFSKSFFGIDDEYKKDYSNTFEIFTIGDNTSIKFEHITTDELASALSASSQLTDVMQSALRRLHKEGEILESFKNKLEELINAFEEEENLKNKRGYNSDTIKSKIYQEMKNDIAGLATLKAISWRFNNLISLGLFKDKNNYGISKIEECLMQRKTAIIRGNVYMLSIFSGYIIKHFYKKRRLYKENINKAYVEKFPPFFLMVDEAHNFCPKGRYDMPIKSIIKEIAQEGRKYGVFLILASQRPALIEDTTVAQINTKFIFRTVRASDKEMIAEETDLNQAELNRLPYLNSGDAFISSGIIGRTIFIRFRTSKTESPHSDNPFDELDKIFSEKLNNEKIINEDIIEYLNKGNIINTLRLHDAYIEIFKNSNIKIKFDDFEKTLESLASNKIIEKEETMFGDIYKI